MKVVNGDDKPIRGKQKLTDNEKKAKREEAKKRSIKIASVGGAFNINNAESSFYSPQLSTDFLELPQSEREKRELFRFWYNTDPIVGSAIDFHTDVPMSKIRLSLPRGKDHKRNKQILHFFEEMCKRIRLFQNLYDATHEYWLHGVAYIFMEDHDLTDDVADSMLISDEEIIEETDSYGYKKQVKKAKKVNSSDASSNLRSLVADKYKGWQRMQILPPEQVKLEVFQYTNRVQMELLPSERDKALVARADSDEKDFVANRIANEIPDQIRQSLVDGGSIPLNTSPYDDYICSSFAYCLSHKKSPYDNRGVSLLERCLRTLLYRDKLRQAQTSIASRAMTPKRVIWGDKISPGDVLELRDQVEQALIDPDFSIITNFEVHWDEVGARDRLLDLNGEYELTNKLLFIGLRITESMLTGESSYSGERIHLDVMNTMYLLYRETIVDFVENYIFTPVALKKGFYEIDEYGNKNILIPRLQFTRLALRDNTELQDYMFNLYQKGSLPISFILELLNIDSDSTLEQLKKDVFTMNDSVFNETLKSIYQKVGDEIASNTDVSQKIAEYLNLSMKKGKDRFDDQ